MTAETGTGRRLAARGIDELLVVVVQVAFVVPAAVLGSSDGAADGRREEIAVAAFCLVFMGWFVGVCYEVSANHLGGGPGKRLLGLRVLAEGSREVLPLHASIVRWLLVNGAQPLVWWCPVGAVLADSTPARVGLVAVAAVALLWRGVLLASVLRSDGGTGGLHDRLVGSRVVAALPHERVDGGPGDADALVEGAR